jgi:hypothetical protein
MTQTATLQKLRRRQWLQTRKLLRAAYQEGMDAGIARAHGQGRRGRNIRGDATVAGLIARIERHFGLDRYAFQIRIVHPGSGRRVPASDLLQKYRTED